MIDKIEVPIIRVKDSKGRIHEAGTMDYDQLYIDSDGHIQYINTRTQEGTENGKYRFIAAYHNGVTVIDTWDPLEYYSSTTNDVIYTLKSDLRDREEELEAAHDTIDDMARGGD